MENKNTIQLSVLMLMLFFFVNAVAQIKNAPDRAEGEGPWSQLIIRGATLINGTLSPPDGPVDIVVENNIIKNIVNVGQPGNKINPNRRPKLEAGGKEIDAGGMYILPGFVDTHAHIGGAQAPDPEYVFKLWMAHGVTTIAEPGSMNGLGWVVEHKNRSARNEITAPRIRAYTVFGQGSKEPIATAEQARAWVRENAKKGADGIKFFEAAPEVMKAAIDENNKLGLRAKMHHNQRGVGRWNALNSARAGLTSLEHWYGLPEALFDDRTVQDYPLDYNYSDEFDRFGEAGKLWKQAAKPFTDKWNEVMNELLDLDFTLSPTMVIYSASRDLMRARRAEWHEEYDLPVLWDFFEPAAGSHGSYWFDWGTEQEVEWKKNYKLWMTFLNEYKNRSGRVTVGTDAGFIYQTYGFAYVTELEMLREAGFHPLEVINSATLKGAEALGMDDEIGTVEVGKKADFVLLDENPLKNLQVLYGTGAISLDRTQNKPRRIGGVVYTIKDGIIYDAKELLEDVKRIVDAEKTKTNYKIIQPGMKD